MSQKFQTVLLLFLLPFFAFAQSAITGTVLESNGLPALGATVSVKGSSNGTSTDFDGKYKLNNVAENTVIVFSFIGYTTQEIPYTGQSVINVTLEENPSELETIVLIGYGSTTKENVTAAQTTVKAEEFNKGAIVSPGQLLAGKAAGVQVTAASGRPGDGPRIRVRAGSTLSASADPLYVVDGIPLDATNANLNTINPADIKSFTILKDASATAIYGNRASNGVIIIETKKGKMSSELQMGYSVQFAVNKNADRLHVLTGDEFRTLMGEIGDAGDISLLGTANTDWQDQIYQNGTQVIHNFTLEKGFESTAIRASLGYTNQEGTVKTSGYERTSLNTSIIQNLLKNDLKLTLSIQAAQEEIRGDQGNLDGAVGSAVVFDPTQPVFDPSGANGFFEYFQSSGLPDPNAPRNPLGLLESLNAGTENNQIRATLQADYSVRGVEGLSLNGTLGIDYNEFDSFSNRLANSAVGLLNLNLSPSSNGFRNNQLLNGRVDYKKDLESIDTKMELTVGSSYQGFRRESLSFSRTNTGDVIEPFRAFNENKLISLFGRATFDIKDLLVLSASISRDGTSRFSPDNRWGTFGGASAGLKLTNTDFVQNSGFISQLKLRGGYGVTGQQEIGQDFLFINRSTASNGQAQVQIGDQFFTTIRPELTTDLKWEETSQYNVGLDYGFFEDRLTGSIDVYTRDTEDLLQFGPLAAGSLGNFALQNVGSTRSRGIELDANVKLYETENFNWNVGANLTFNEIEITDLSLGDNDNPVGQTPLGFNGFIQEWALGSDPTAFVVFRQVYDQDGNPLDGVFVDRNGDNVINSDDKVRYKKGNPDAYFGFTSNLNYKQFDMSFTFRGQVGGYNYNGVRAARENADAITENTGEWLNNTTVGFLDTRFESAPSNLLFSSEYIENSDFVRLDNLSLGYTFNTDNIGIRASLTGTNLFVLTDYSGLDPEIGNGVDGAVFPRSRGIIFGLNFNF